jgi:putative ABC transport system permease protein
MLKQLIVQALRLLSRRQNQSFVWSCVLILGLGIGIATAMWSIAYQILLAPLPFAQPDRIVHLAERNDAQNLPEFAVSEPNFNSWRRDAPGLSGVIALRDVGANVVDGKRALHANAMAASADMWRVLGLPLLRGRAFTPGEENSRNVVIIGEQFWRAEFAGDSRILGRTLQVNGGPRTVVGIAPQDLGFSTTIDLWLPLEATESTTDRGDRRLLVLARLADGISLESVRQQLDAYATQLDRQFPQSNLGWRIDVKPVSLWIVGDTLRTRLQLLLAAVAIILLVACANVAGLQVARASARVREFAVRQALGATRTDLLRQLAVENSVLVLLGGAIGVAFASALIRLAVISLPASTPRLAGLTLSLPVVSTTALFCMLVAFLFGLLPTFLATRRDHALATQGGRGESDQRRALARRGLVVTQFALVTVLTLFAAHVLLQLSQLQKTPLGFDSNEVLTAKLALPDATDETLRPYQQGYADLIEKIAALPGVRVAGLTNEIPQGEVDTQMRIVKFGYNPQTGGAQASWRMITGSYLDAMSIPVMAGRNFAANDEPRDSVLLSDNLARQLWADPKAAIGAQVMLGNGQVRQVIGIVADVRQRDIAAESTPTMYFPITWFLWSPMTIVARVNGDSDNVVSGMRSATSSVFPDYALFDFKTMQEAVNSNLAQPKLQGGVLLAFALAGLLLAVLGMAGLIGFLVNQQRRELAIRMALGATAQRVLRGVMSGGSLLCLSGIGLGLVCAFGLHWLSPIVATSTPSGTAFAVTAALAILFGAGLLSIYVPARQTLKIMPSAVLRS